MSIIGAGIYDGDLLVVDGSIEPVHGQVVVAAINDEMTVKRLYNKSGEVKLQADSPHFRIGYSRWCTAVDPTDLLGFLEEMSNEM